MQDEDEDEFGPDDSVEVEREIEPGHLVLESQPISRQVFGSIALYFGAFLLLIATCEAAGGQLSFLPRFWYVNRSLWIGFGLLLIPIGVAIQAQRPVRRVIWKPTRLGRRFSRIRVYTRAGCHLCDVVLATLQDPQYSPYLPMPEEVDVDADPELRQRFGTLVPVVEFDGKIRFTARIDEVLLRRLIEGTHPTTLECHRPN